MVRNVLLVWLFLEGAIWTAIGSTFESFSGAEDGRLYAVDRDGGLLFFQHFPENELASWPNGTGSNIGSGWQSFVHLAYGHDGIVYAVGADGALLYYRDLARDGTVRWANDGVGVEIGLGRGWADYRWVLGDANGVLYVIDPSGVMSFYRHASEDATPVWANAGQARILGGGWQRYQRVIAGRDGVFFGITAEGDLYYHRDRARDGTVDWETAPEGLYLGKGWDRYSRIFSTGRGTLYAIDCQGAIYFSQVTVTNGAATWSAAQAKIGNGFYPNPIEGYCWPLSAAPGETIDFHVSGAGPTAVTFLRHSSTTLSVSSTPMGTATFFSSWQPTPSNVIANGCGWPSSYTLRIPSDWPSGIYSARCGLGDDCASHITFVVKPPPARHQAVALLANINTWLAYNEWGGGSKYLGHHAQVTFLRPAPDTSPVGTEFGPLHQTRAELWILSALQAAGYAPDLYTDLDLHNDLDLSSYRCLIFGTHPEYWTVRMYENLQRYLAAGGCVLYLGGNGIYETCSYTPAQTELIFRNGIEGGPREAALFRVIGLPERALLGVATERCGVLGAPYQIQHAEHPLFRGTGLSNGDVVGLTGLNTGWGNGMAAGFEVDTSAGAGALGIPTDCNETSPTVPPGPGLPSHHLVLATATNWFKDGRWQGAEMTYYPHPGGGFLFSVGSLTFGGSLVVDGQLLQILRNALDDALSGAPRLTLRRGPGQTSSAQIRGRAGASYQLQRADSLSDLNWLPFATVTLENTLSIELLIENSSSQMFLRMQLAP
ncbi:MAG TPA: N,N-dimethylformamidase beta subunit family domain-containing protein [Verrucomicrobiae bacterium]|nr:N,N-dimethylformamidase beta subunit family domain-containing protein [Verrucomicrobiae bacterium]